MRNLVAVWAMASLATVAAAAEPAIADRWNLADLYASAESWSADAARVESQLRDVEACRGHLGDSAARLAACLDLRADVVKRLYRLAVYAGEQLSSDTGNAAFMALDQRVEVVSSRVNEAAAFFDPEIVAIGAARIDAFVAAEPALRPYRYPLSTTLRAAAHTLDAEGEALIARFGLMGGTGQAAFSVLSDADIPWPAVQLADGQSVVIDTTSYTKHREAADRGDRKKVMDAFFATWKTYERTAGVLLSSQLRQDTVYSRVRKFPDAISQAFDASHMPVAVYDTLIAETNANLPTLHRYFRLRAKMLGVAQMRYYDIYPPLVRGDYRFPLAMAKQLTLEAVAPLGSDYVRGMAAGFEGRWMDAYPQPRKRSGAHMQGSAYDVHPYVLMNYNEDYESVTTLAHEWGHAMHSVLANKAQPFVTADYATFIAEIASTFNEALLLERVLKTAKTADERLYFLGAALEGLRATFFRQAMFAEFERSIHALSDKGEPVTGDVLTKTYCDVLKRYHGHDQGVVTIDDAYCVEWAFIPHFYNGFYVYQYATSIAASSLFADRVAGGDSGALERYLNLLKAGGSGDPYELVKTAGVDLATPAPYRSLALRMNRIMDEIEAILARRR